MVTLSDGPPLAMALIYPPSLMHVIFLWDDSQQTACIGHFYMTD